MSAMLDAITQVEIWKALRALAARRRIGVLAISHSIELLDRIADRCFHLVDGSLRSRA
jgi:peptide/nickel transport system ATP-binding protein